MQAMSRLYVQSLSQGLPQQDTDSPTIYNNKLERLRELIDTADAIVLGVGSGVSTAADYDFYHGSEAFDRRFGAFERAHGFDTLFDGLYHVFGANEEQWAFQASVMDWLAGLPVGQPYRNLAMLMRGREHFVITTNVDGQVPRAFGSQRSWTFQGDLRFLQCAQPCNDKVVDATRIARELVAQTQPDDNGTPRVPADALPRCQDCGWLMVPWARDEHFLEGGPWQRQHTCYKGFLTRHLIDSPDRVLFLELGVSSMTPAVIRMPFWDMVARNPQTNYVCVNMRETSSPAQLGERGLTITADIARVAADLLQGPS